MKVGVSLLVSALMTYSSLAFTAGISGVPSSITGVSESRGETDEAIGRTARNASQYFVEQVNTHVIPQPGAYARKAQGRDVTDDGGSVVSPVANVQRVDTGSAQIDQQQPVTNQKQTRPSAPVVPSRIEYVLPEGMREVKVSKNGAADVNGDAQGTYLLRVPPFYFSRFRLPFEAEFTVPFPDHVVIQKKAGMLLVAPKTNIPLNLIMYHPQKPDVSVAFVLMPDGQSIPATVDVKFDQDRLPTLEPEKNHSAGSVVGLGILTQAVAPNSNAAMQFEQSSDHIAVIEDIHRLVSKGLVPDGYSLDLITEGVTGAMCGDRRLIGKFAQRMSGDQFTVDVFQVTNAHDDVIRFEETNCYRQGVVSVQFFPSRTLSPGSMSELIIVHAKPVEDQPVQQRRPSLVGR